MLIEFQGKADVYRALRFLLALTLLLPGGERLQGVDATVDSGCRFTGLRGDNVSRATRRGHHCEATVCILQYFQELNHDGGLARTGRTPQYKHLFAALQKLPESSKRTLLRNSKFHG